MKTNDKQLTNQFCVNLDQETADLLRRLADTYQRKPSELLRLVSVPQLLKLWQEIQREEHPENQASPTLARFTK